MTEDEFLDSLDSVDRKLNAFQAWQKIKEVIAATNPNLDEWGASLEQYAVFSMWRIFSVSSEDGSSSAPTNIETASTREVMASLEAFRKMFADTLQDGGEIDDENISDLIKQFNAAFDR